jgi:hypothetical protein
MTIVRWLAGAFAVPPPTAASAMSATLRAPIATGPIVALASVTATSAPSNPPTHAPVRTLVLIV